MKWLVVPERKRGSRRKGKKELERKVREEGGRQKEGTSSRERRQGYSKVVQIYSTHTADVMTNLHANSVNSIAFQATPSSHCTFPPVGFF